MSKPTKGPWEYPGGTFIIHRDNEGSPLVVARLDYGKPLAEYTANGEFITRACNAHDELLEVAKLFRAELALCMEMSGPLAEKVLDLEAIVNAAIAKAEGEDK